MLLFFFLLSYARAGCGLCQTCETNICTLCVNNATVVGADCLCDYGFYNDTELECIQCEPPCTDCDSAIVCLDCVDNSSLVGNECICNDGFYLNPSGFCNQCDSTCKICSQFWCEECVDLNASPDYLSAEGKCKCKDGYYLKGEGCEECHFTCQKCTESVCSICEDSNSKPDYLANDGSCVCNIGYFLNVSTCEPCDATCAQCNTTNCLACASPVAFPNGLTCECQENYYITNTNSCASCDISCSSCNSTTCFQCKDPSATIENTLCTCPSNCYSIDSSISCNPCPDNCNQCTNPTSCSNCIDPNALPINGICTCIEGYLLVNNLCVLCDNSCKTCSSTSICETCNDPNAVVDPLGNYCICPNGFYKNIICLPCDATCEICNQTLCLTCKDQTSTVLENICICPEFTYFDNGKCYNCIEGCEKCDVNGCSQCKEYSSVNNGICICDENRVMTNGECICIKGFVDTGTCVECQNFVEINDISEAFFDVDYLSVLIVFNLTMEVSDVLCKDMVRAESLEKIGENPNCEWVNSNVFEIEFGVTPNFTGGSISLISKNFVSVDGTCRSSPQLLSPSITYKYPIPQPYLTIIGPDKASQKCTRYLTYYAIGSFGLGNHVSLEWVPDTSLWYTTIGNSITYDISSIRSDTLTVNLTGRNIFGVTSSILYQTKIYTENYLTLVLNTGRNVSMWLDQQIDAIVNVLDNCGNSNIDNDYWIWSYLKGSMDEDTVLSKTINNTVSFPPNFLTSGLFLLKASLSRGGVQGEVYLDLSIKSPPLVLILSRSTGSISTFSSSEISGKYSYDPSGFPLSFHWDIQGYSGNLTTTSDTITLDPVYLKKTTLIILTLSISTTISSTSETINLFPNSADIQVTNFFTTKKYNLPQLYQINITADPGISLYWTQKNTDIVISKYSFFMANSNFARESYILNFAEFDFYIDVPVKVNLPPTCNNLWVNATTGIAVEDVFKVVAFECFDLDENDYPLVASFGMNNSENSYVVIGKTYLLQYDMKLIPGEVTIFAKICDVLEKCSVLYTEIIEVAVNIDVNSTAAYEMIVSDEERVAEAIIVICNNGKVENILVERMWNDLTGEVSSDIEVLYLALSALNALVPFSMSKLDSAFEFISLLSSIDEYSSLLAFQFVSNVVSSAENINDIYNLNNFLISSLESLPLLPGNFFTLASPQISLYKSSYIYPEVIPENIGNFPDLIDNITIYNFWLIHYTQPENFISISFSNGGSYSNYIFEKTLEKILILHDIEIIGLAINSSETSLTCYYINSTGAFTNDGCFILDQNETHANLSITHTSLFMISDSNSFLLLPQLTDCKTAYFPTYLLLLILTTGLFLIIIFYKIDEKHKIIETSNLKYINDDEIEHIKFTEKNSEPLPSKTFSAPMPIVSQKKLLDFHMFLGLRTYDPLFNKSLKMFVIVVTGVCELFFIGLFLTSFENTGNPDVTIVKSKYLAYAAMSVAVTLPLQLAMIVCFSLKRTTNGYALAFAFAGGVSACVTFTIYIISYNYKICEAWAYLWGYIYLYAFLGEIFFLHIFLMFFSHFYSKHRSKVDIER